VQLEILFKHPVLVELLGKVKYVLLLPVFDDCDFGEQLEFDLVAHDQLDHLAEQPLVLAELHHCIDYHTVLWCKRIVGYFSQKVGHEHQHWLLVVFVPAHLQQIAAHQFTVDAEGIHTLLALQVEQLQDANLVGFDADVVKHHFYNLCGI